MTLDGEEMKSS